MDYSDRGRDVHGKPTLASMAFNYSIVPARPAGGAWTSAADLIRYVQLELAQGKLPNGKQLVSAENLRARRAPQIALGEDGFEFVVGERANKRVLIIRDGQHEYILTEIT